MQDLELRTTTSGKSIVRFTLAVNEGYGEDQRTNFINCEVWNKLAENLHKYCSKGSSLLLEGCIRVESYDGQDGQKRYVTKVVVQNYEFLDSKKSKEETIDNNVATTTGEKEDPFSDFTSEIQISDDDLPF